MHTLFVCHICHKMMRITCVYSCLFSLCCRESFQMEKDRPLPKFGEWDVNDPASAEGFTVIFNKARDERKTGGNTPRPESPAKDGTSFKNGSYAPKSNSVSSLPLDGCIIRNCGFSP